MQVKGKTKDLQTRPEGSFDGLVICHDFIQNEHFKEKAVCLVSTLTTFLKIYLQWFLKY